MKDNDTLVRLLIVPESRFNLRDMERIARRFLEGAAKAHSTAVLSIYANERVAAAERVGCEGNYLQWKLLYDLFPQGVLLTADVISIRGDAVLRLRTSDGSIVRRVLSGKDPTQMSVDGVPLEILFVWARIRTRFEGCGTPGAVEPVFYLRTGGTLSDSLCERVTSGLAAGLRAKHIWTYFANIPWFPCDARFPMRYAFSVPEPPPSEDTFYTYPMFSCVVFCDGKLTCSGEPRLPPLRRPRAD